MSVQPLDENQAVVVYRWRRWGQDRAYVKVGDVQFGYRDLRSGEVRCLQLENREFVARVTDGLYDKAAERARSAAYQPKHSRRPVCEPDAVDACVDEPIHVREAGRDKDDVAQRYHEYPDEPVFIEPVRPEPVFVEPRVARPRRERQVEPDAGERHAGVPHVEGRTRPHGVAPPQQQQRRVPLDDRATTRPRRISDAEDRARRGQIHTVPQSTWTRAEGGTSVRRVPPATRTASASPVLPPMPEARALPVTSAPPAAPSEPSVTPAPQTVSELPVRRAVENKVWGDVPQARQRPAVDPPQRAAEPTGPYDTRPRREVPPSRREPEQTMRPRGVATQTPAPRRAPVNGPTVWGTISEPPPAPKHEPRFEGATRNDVDLSIARTGNPVAPRADDLLQKNPSRRHMTRRPGRALERRRWGHGELEVGQRLDKLGDGWRVLHCVPVGNRGGDVDHVVIGPAGVFVVNDKAHPGCSVWVRNDTFKVNDITLNYVRHSRHEARQTTALLTAAVGFEVPVRGIIAVLGAERGYSVREQPHDVTVIKADDIVRALRKRPRVLDGATVELIYAAARRLSTWQAQWSEPS